MSKSLGFISLLESVKKYKFLLCQLSLQTPTKKFISMKMKFVRDFLAITLLTRFLFTIILPEFICRFKCFVRHSSISYGVYVQVHQLDTQYPQSLHY